MNNYVIEGGHKLSGTVTINPSKNSAVAMLVASMMNKGTTTLGKLPEIEEVKRIIEVMESIGVKVNWTKDGNCRITPPEKFKIEKINVDAAIKTRSVILFIGALANTIKKFSLPMSGGCKLGRRSILPHIYALEELGVKIKKGKGEDSIAIDCSGVKAKDRTMLLYESGDTVTENAIMIAATSTATTTIKFASANYQVQDLCFFLEKFGVQFEGLGTTTLTIKGVSELNKDVEFYLTEDPPEAMFFISLAATTNSSLIIKRCPIDFLELELYKLKKMGFKFKLLKEYVSYNGRGKLVDLQTLPSKLKASPEKVDARPFPGVNIDNLPFFVPIATQAEGETLIHDHVFENRATYYTDLNRMGAKITLADPHRVFIKGPTPLSGAELICPPALRPSAVMLIAMLAASGKSTLKDVYQMERGYENLCGRLSKLGAKIKKVED